MFKTVYDNQKDIIDAILNLHVPEGFEADLTYGNGAFYKDVEPPLFCFDIDPQQPQVAKADSGNVPLPNGTLRNVMFDPPFLTYIKQGREHPSLTAKRFGGYWRYDELEEHYKNTLIECHRLLKTNGKLVFKCQDIVHNHTLHLTHVNAINWAATVGFRVKDMFILQAKNRLPMPSKEGENPRKQKHARIHHSYFIVFEKVK